MPDERERSGIEVDRADRQLIEQTAAQLHQGAVRTAYAGMEHKHLAFALALVLDRPAPARSAARGLCAGGAGARMLLGGYGAAMACEQPVTVRAAGHLGVDGDRIE